MSWVQIPPAAPKNHNRYGIDRAILRAKAMVLTFLYSGLRISDVACLKRSLITPEGKIIRTLKTGKRVYIKLPPVCVSALQAPPMESKEYLFWSGEGESDLETTIKSMRRTLTCLGRMTQIHVHPHRFRDTFAVAVLVGGIPCGLCNYSWAINPLRPLRSITRHLCPPCKKLWTKPQIA